MKFLRDVLDQDLLQLFAENPKNISSPIHGHILSIMSYQREKIPFAKISFYERSIDLSESW